MYTRHPVSTPAAYTETLQLTSRLWRQHAPYAYWMPGDVTWWRSATPDDSDLRSLLLWYAGDTPVGASWVMGDAVDIIADQTCPGLFAAMIDHVVRTNGVTTAYAFARDSARTAVLQAAGFAAGAAAFRTHLMNPRHAPVVPLTPGWQVQPLPAGDAANAARAAAQRSAFQSTKMTPERYAWARSLPGYTPEWDTVLTTPTGEIAAFVTVWVDAANNAALFEPVGCVHAYKRQGLTRMLFSSVLQRLAAAGIQTASVLSLPVTLETPAGLFYESCGFWPIDHIHAWQRVRRDS